MLRLPESWPRLAPDVIASFAGRPYAEVASILRNYTALIDQARAVNPRVVVVVAQIQRIVTDHCSNHASAARVGASAAGSPAWPNAMPM